MEEQSRNYEHDRLGRELHNLQGALEDKERILRELQEKSKVSKLKETYDKVLKEAAAENEALGKERSKLLKKLQVRLRITPISMVGFFPWGSPIPFAARTHSPFSAGPVVDEGRHRGEPQASGGKVPRPNPGA